MGFYLETLYHTNKTDAILDQVEEAREVSLAEATEINKSIEGVIVIVDNGPFEAAAFAFDQKEFEAFVQPDDIRTKRFVVMPRKMAEELSGFSKC